MILALIAAFDSNQALGKDNTLPWRVPEDLKHFKETTLGKTVIMGRKTFDSVGRPLPRRRNLVITRNPSWKAEGVEVFSSLEEALAAAQKAAASDEEVFIVGGAQIYSEALPRADRLYLTFLDLVVEGADAFFPKINWNQFRLVHQKDELSSSGIPFSIRRYDRI